MSNAPYVIQSNVPLPGPRPSVKYPFQTMAVGESFLVPNAEAGRTANAGGSVSRRQAASRKPVSKFCQRKEPGTNLTRFFRTA